MKIKYFLIRVFLVLGVIGQTLSIGTAHAVSSSSFADVPVSHAHFSAIQELQKRGVIQGYADGTFKPDQPVNRAEALKIILLGSGVKLSAIQGATIFLDVKAEDWYAKYVAYAVQAGIVQGYSDNTFKPGQTVNLVENLKILLLAKKIAIPSVAVTQNLYADAFAKEWYAGYVEYAKTKNLIDADASNKIYPGQGITRGKLAEIMYRLIYIEENKLAAYPTQASQAPTPAPEPVPQTEGAAIFTIDPSSNRQNISPYIYGSNEVATEGSAIREKNLKLVRLGGNRWTAYNWENNASNAGTDWLNSSDDYLSSSNTPGEAVKTRVDQAFAMGAAALITVPMVDYVAADKNGTVDTVASANNPRWNKNFPNSAGAIPSSPDLNDATVYQDQFVDWIIKSYQNQQNSGQKIFYSLDNEPALWPGTHPLVHPQQTTYAEMAQRTIEYATMIKKADPEALVFGAVAYGYYEFVALQGAPDQNGRDYFDFLLDTLKTAGTNTGTRLVDVLDVHWYPEAIGGGVRIANSQGATPSTDEIEARVQAPRSLWDPTYVEDSWISNDVLNKGPIKLIPWLNDKITAHYPGTRLSFSEYNYGGENHISGGLAQADVLGIFGREGIFAATYWPMEFNNADSFSYGAFDLYLNYDGKGGQVGDVSILAQNSNIAQASVYAMVEKNNDDAMYIIAINKTASGLPSSINLQNSSSFSTATVYQLTAAQPKPQFAQSITIQNNTFNYQMPALSASLFVLTP